MPRRPAMRDFIYLSRTRVERIAATLPPKVVARLRDVSFGLGVVSAGVTIDRDSASERVGNSALVAAISEVERAIRKDYEVLPYDDPGVTRGVWIEGIGVEMAYGVPDGSAKVRNAAVFTSSSQERAVMLGGSAAGLLDRSPDLPDPTHLMSNPQAIRELLRMLDGPLPDDSGSLYSYAISNLHASMASAGGLSRVSFLALAVDTPQGRHGENVIIALPLYVELAPLLRR